MRLCHYIKEVVTNSKDALFKGERIENFLEFIQLFEFFEFFVQLGDLPHSFQALLDLFLNNIFGIWVHN